MTNPCADNNKFPAMHAGNLSDIVQFRFALSKDGTIIDANLLSNEDRKDYECLGCAGKVRPILGKIRKKHFRHKNNHGCCPETYLHKLGKILFEVNYKKCLREGVPYHIEYIEQIICNACKEGPCEQTSPKIHKYDITKLFTYIEVEKTDGNCKPDILLKTVTGHKIYVEIFVTHETTYEKTNSGVKIIEFIIQNENDLEIFKENLVSISNPLIKLYNFNPPFIYKNFYDGCCRANEILDTQTPEPILPKRDKHNFKPFIIPDSIVCCICGKATNNWVSFNPNKCRDCLKKAYEKG